MNATTRKPAARKPAKGMHGIDPEDTSMTLCKHRAERSGNLKLTHVRQGIKCPECVAELEARDKAHPCPECKGSCECVECGATGGQWDEEDNWIGQCEHCHEEGDCPECKGTGIDPDYPRML